MHRRPDAVHLLRKGMERIMSEQHTIAGRVMYAPSDHGAPSPAKGVVVASDRNVCVTNERGEYELPVTPEDRFVRVSAPRGYAPTGDWYHVLTPEGLRGRADFTLASDAARDADAFTFIQITDIHMRSNGRVTPDALRRDLDTIMDRWADRVAFIAATGDLSDRAQRDELQACWDVFRDQPVPVFALPGNHDYWDHASPGEAYKSVFGPTSYSFDWGPVHFVAYDSITDSPESSHRLWLERDLSQLPPDRPIIMLTHYQLDDSFFRLWDRFPLIASISGHWHSSRLVHDGMRTHYNGPPLSFGGIDYSPRGYRVFRWEDGQLSAETFTLTHSGRRVIGVGGGEAATALQTSRARLEPLWDQELPGKVHMASPVVHGDRVYMSTLFEDAPGKGAVSSLDASTGQVIWSQAVGDSVKNNVAYADGTVYGVTVSGTVFALDAETGDVLWKREAEEPSRRWVFSAPVYHDGRIYVGSAGHFRCLDATTGSVLWYRNDIGGDDWISSYCNPVVVDSLVLIGFQWKGVGLVALDPASGKTVWSQHGGNHASVGTTPGIAEQHAYALYHGGTLRKLECDSGEIVWEVPGLASWSPAAPVVGEGRVYMACGDGRLAAFDTERGQELWQQQLTRHSDRLVDVAAYSREHAPLLAAPLLLDTTLWVASSTGELVALDAEDGRVLLRHDLGVPLLSAPAHQDGRLFLADTSGRLHAFKIG